MKEERKPYEAPTLTVVEFVAERGFASSDVRLHIESNDDEMTFQEHSSWTSSGGFWD